MPDDYKTTDGRKVMVAEDATTGRFQGVVVITGDGVPTLVGIGSPDLPAETWLSIENRFLPGSPYDAVTRIHLGVLALDPGRDGSRFDVRGLGTAGHGRASASSLGDIKDGVASDEYGVSAWLVSHAKGRVLAVLPSDMDSLAVRDEMERGIEGDFVVEAVSSGSIRAGGDLRVRGWGIVREVQGAEPAPGPR